MTPTNYDKHFKVLGKLCRLYDTGGGDLTAMKTLVSRLYDQLATGELASYDAVVLFGQYTNVFDAAIGGTTYQLRTIVMQISRAYLISAIFRNDLTTVPSSPTDAVAVLAALRTEMSAAVDNKKLTTEVTTGLVNFFRNVLAAGGTWNTAADASADYKDSVYVVDTIVA